jgi:hypothetical protein
MVNIPFEGGVVAADNKMRQECGKKPITHVATLNRGEVYFGGMMSSPKGGGHGYGQMVIGLCDDCAKDIPPSEKVRL